MISNTALHITLLPHLTYSKVLSCQSDPSEEAHSSRQTLQAKSERNLVPCAEILRRRTASLERRSARLSERKMRFSFSDFEANSSYKYSETVDQPNSLRSANIITLIRFSVRVIPSSIALFAFSSLALARECCASVRQSRTCCRGAWTAFCCHSI